jgi:hypothetical protein
LILLGLISSAEKEAKVKREQELRLAQRQAEVNRRNGLELEKEIGKAIVTYFSKVIKITSKSVSYL